MIEKQAGRFTAQAWTEGWPIWITIDDARGEKLTLLEPEDLRDLQYVLERLQQQLEPYLYKRPPGIPGGP